MIESHEVLAEQAQVELVRLQLILKPASKKEKITPQLMACPHPIQNDDGNSQTVKISSSCPSLMEISKSTGA